MILIEVVFEASTDGRDGFAQLARETTHASSRELGCILYRFTVDLNYADRFILTELWETEEHLRAHFDGEAFKHFFAELPALGRLVRSTEWQGPLASYVRPNVGDRPR